MYLLDANVFIQAKNTYYSFDVCPGFWNWIIQARAEGKIASITSVFQELRAGNDYLKDWASEHQEIFLPTEKEENISVALQAVSTWVYNQNYHGSAISSFLSQADYYICAHALAGGHTIITHEQPQPESKKRVLIPDVCLGLKIQYQSIHSLLQNEKARFILET